MHYTITFFFKSIKISGIDFLCILSIHCLKLLYEQLFYAIEEIFRKILLFKSKIQQLTIESFFMFGIGLILPHFCLEQLQYF